MSKRALHPGIVIVLAVLSGRCAGRIACGPSQERNCPRWQCRPGRGGEQPQWGRGGGLGDRRNHRPANQIRQDRRHRRSGALSGAGSSQGELQCVGSRLRAGGFAEGQSHTGQDPEPEGGRGAGQEGCSRILSRAVLVLFAAGAAQERFPGHGADRERHCFKHQEPGRMDSPDRQHGRLHRLSSDGRQGHARDSQEYPQSVRGHESRVGSPDSRPARRAAG